MTSRRRRRRVFSVQNLENRMVLSGLGLMAGLELPADETICVAKTNGKVDVAKGAAKAGASESTTKPFKIKGAGTVDFLPLGVGQVSPFTATGTATNLGKYSGAGSVQVDAFLSETVAKFSSGTPFEFTGANGDKILFDFEGEVVLTPLEGGKVSTTWTAEFTPVDGQNTGKFANVTGGSFIMVAESGPIKLTDTDIPFTWSGSGDLEYSKSLPYKASGLGSYSFATGDYGGTGVGTHVGDHTFSGNITATPTDNPLVLDFETTAPQTIIAANGDELYVSLSGQVTLIPQGEDIYTAVWSGDAEVVGGTGRFEGALPGAQPMKVVAENSPFAFADAQWSFAWTLEGPIVLR